MQPDAPPISSSIANGADQLPAPPSPSIVATAPGQLRVIKRNGTVVTYDDDKIQVALTKAFLAVEGGTAAASSRIRDSGTFRRRLPSGGTINIEGIQDQVELAPMRSGEHKVARDYVLYREERARIRAANAGTMRSQLSSCFLTTVADDLDGIYSAIRDNALLSKWAGGLGNDWTPVRALGSYIKGTNGKSQGVVPFLNVVNDTAVAVNQCFAPDTRVHTADGIKRIRDVTTDDLVLGQRGEYRQVLDTMTYNQTDPMVEVRVKHGVKPLHVTAGHPFWAIPNVPMEQANGRTQDWLAKGKVKPEWVDAGELGTGDYVVQVIPKEVVPVAGFDDDARL